MPDYNFNEPGVFGVEPIERDPERHVIYHEIQWIPEGWSGVVVGHIVTDRATAAKLVDRLNAGSDQEKLREAAYERGYDDGRDGAGWDY